MGKVNGVPCEFQICNEHSYLHLLEQGWHYTPEECYAEKKQEIDDKTTSKEILDETEVPEAKEVPETSKEDTESEPDEEENAIRKAAKDADIDHWHVKSIKRLKKELKELEEDAGRSED